MQFKLEYRPPVNVLDDTLALLLGDNPYVILSSDGIILPSCLGLGLHLRLCRSWTDVNNVLVRWRGNLEFQPSDCLILKFKSGGAAKICLIGLSLRSLEKLLLSLETWAKDAVKSDEFSNFKENAQALLRGAGDPSFTDIWEDELSRRFSNTTFVPLVPGTHLQSDRLQVMTQLAFGGFSAVYMVKDRQNKAMILKELVIPKGLSEGASGEVRKHFAREAKILAQLNHEQLVKVLDYFVEDSRSYLLLEYVPGENLRRLVPKGGLPESVAVGWAIQMCRVLEYLHSQSPPVVHRDFTPENMILNTAGKVVLIDFNAAFELLCTATSTVVGKYAYMAPEQFRGHSEPASDLYSLGCVLFFLLTGQDPEPISTNSPQKLRPNVSQEIDAIVLQLTQFDSSSRPASASVVRSSLERLNVVHDDETSRPSLSSRK